MGGGGGGAEDGNDKFWRKPVNVILKFCVHYYCQQ